jgi:hypothetical protein
MVENDDSLLPDQGNAGKIVRGLLQVASSVPFVGGLLSAVASAWSERNQEKFNEILKEYLMRIKDEIEEQKKTLAEIFMRLDAQDTTVRERFESPKYQDLVKKAFRNWSEIDSEDKRILIRNLLINAAALDVTSDDVIKMFIEWIHKYSTLHFSVIGAIYNNKGITRGGVWDKIGKAKVREDSAEADLYKLLYRDLSTGSIIRQQKEKDGYGNFLNPSQVARTAKGSGPKPMVSAFDREDPYELTSLGEQFVHYAMTDLPPKLDFGSSNEAKDATDA